MTISSLLSACYRTSSLTLYWDRIPQNLSILVRSKGKDFIKIFIQWNSVIMKGGSHIWWQTNWAELISSRRRTLVRGLTVFWKVSIPLASTWFSLTTYAFHLPTPFVFWSETTETLVWDYWDSGWGGNFSTMLITDIFHQSNWYKNIQNSNF